MTDEQIEQIERADVGRRWGALETAVEDAAVEVDAEGQNGNLVRQAFEETRAAVEAEIERLRALVRQTREEADAAVQRAAEGELAARADVDRLTARLQTAEKAAHEWRERAGRVAESSWDKAHVEAGFYEWLEDLRKGRHEGEWEPFKVAVERAEAGA